MMMKLKYLLTLFIVLSCSAVFAQQAKYKCMLQMDGYTGEPAYLAVSLINPKNNYQKTLYILGKDAKWYNSFKEWFKVFGKNKKLDAKTGASVGGGDRAMIILDLDEKWINAGYKLRFESSVEDKNYYPTDVEIALTTDALSNKTDGKGYIKYIRFSKLAN